ncbi:MAG: hypothetical protein PHD32_02585 [Eubacteriales bacterium]|nr:hypothetical protein [Eubacteriales bacterium]
MVHNNRKKWEFYIVARVSMQYTKCIASENMTQRTDGEKKKTRVLREMNISVLQQGGIDYTAGLKRFSGDRELYETILAAFLYDACLDKVRSAYERGDYQAMVAGVHEMKGASGNVDMNRLYKAACDLLDKLRGSGSTVGSEVGQCYEAFSSAYLAAQEAIRQALKE